MDKPVGNLDKYATILRYVIGYILAPIAAKKGLDAATTGNMIDALLAFLLALATVAPMVYNLLTRPSSAAMKVAEEADKIIAGDQKAATVKTPSGQPDIKVTNVNANVGHG